MKLAKVTEYFNKSQGFELLPSDYQNRVIRFFSVDIHYMVDVSYVRFLLSSAHRLITFETFQELTAYSKNGPIEGLIACKKCNWPSMDDFTQWGEKVSSLIGEKTDLVFFAHVFQFENDSPEEWYIASC